MWVIPRTIVNKMLGHAQRSAPAECVGILSGNGQTITGWHPLANTANDSRKFLADPQGQIELMRELRQSGREVCAIYHSHPDAPPRPSASDLAEAYYQEALYLIISLATDGCLELEGWLIEDGSFIVQQIDITEKSG